MTAPVAGGAGAAALVHQLVAGHPEIAARIVEKHDTEVAAELVVALPPRAAARLIFHLNPDMATALLSRLATDVGTAIVAASDPVDAAYLVDRLPEDTRTAILAPLRPALKNEIASILEFPTYAAGRLMESDVTRFSEQVQVSVVLETLRTLRDRQIIDLVTTDDEGHFSGIVPLQSLLRARPTDVLAGFVVREAQSVHPMATREDVVAMLQRHNLTSVPVVDSHKRVLGLIRQEGLIEAAQQTVAQDMQQMFGGSGEESVLSPSMFSVRSRLPWLNINLLTAFAAAAVVGLFQDTLARFTALAVLLPVVAGQSGNTGSQALAVTMRSLTLREIRPTQVFRVMRKELFVGMMNGFSIALVTSAGTYVWSRNIGLSLIMFTAMVVSMIIASMAGGLVPMVLSRLGRDPAVASSIILTTVTDIFGFFTFLGLATVLSSMLTGL